MAQAIPTSAMSVFKLPNGVCKKLNSMIAQYWSGKGGGKMGIHWLLWDKLCDRKKKGGLGFRDLIAFNRAMLAKIGWRLIHEPGSLMATVLNVKYFPNRHFLEVATGRSISFV